MSLLEDALRRQRELENQRGRKETASSSSVPGKSPAAVRPSSSKPLHKPLEMPEDPVPPAIREALRRNRQRGLPKAALAMPLVAIVIFAALLYARRAVVQIGGLDETRNERPISPPMELPAPILSVTPVEKPDGTPPEEVPDEGKVVPRPSEEVPEETVAAPVAAAPAKAVVRSTWPLFRLKGIATGNENIVILDTGEMLVAGEKSRTGVVVDQVGTEQAVFSWQGERKTLRQGETSDR